MTLKPWGQAIGQAYAGTATPAASTEWQTVSGHEVAYVGDPSGLECSCGWAATIRGGTVADLVRMTREHLTAEQLTPVERDAQELANGRLPRGWACTLETTPANIRWVAENIGFGLTAANYPELSEARRYAVRCMLDRIARRGHNTREEEGIGT